MATENDYTLRNAVLRLWIRTGEPCTAKALSNHLCVDVLPMLNACGWKVAGTDFAHQGGSGTLEPTKAFLRDYILSIKPC